jgi:hypothetical protein
MSTTCEKCGQTTEYQGWPNYETWAVKLWMDNDEGSYLYWGEQAREAKRQAPSCEPVQQGIWSADDAPRYTLADQLKEEVTEGAPDLGASMYADLLGAALEGVKWNRIAESLLEDCEE